MKYSIKAHVTFYGSFACEPWVSPETEESICDDALAHVLDSLELEVEEELPTYGFHIESASGARFWTYSGTFTFTLKAESYDDAAAELEIVFATHVYFISSFEIITEYDMLGT